LNIHIATPDVGLKGPFISIYKNFEPPILVMADQNQSSIPIMQDPVKQGFWTEETAKSLELNGFGKRPIDFPEKIRELKIVIKQHNLWKLNDDEDLFLALKDKGVINIPWVAMQEAYEDVKKKELKKIKREKTKSTTRRGRTSSKKSRNRVTSI
jgi:hypothetical protein